MKSDPLADACVRCSLHGRPCTWTTTASLAQHPRRRAVAQAEFTKKTFPCPKATFLANQDAELVDPIVQPAPATVINDDSEEE